MIELRELEDMTELTWVEQVQEEVWNATGRSVVPRELLRAMQASGALVAGAFDGTAMVGFIFAYPTMDSTRQHSHKLGVLPAYRGLGISEKLKWFQRDWCLERDITQVVWTFDPLRTINAHLNIAKLGAVSNVYLPNYYGPMEGVNTGTPSDRLEAEWDLRSPRVEERHKSAHQAVRSPNEPKLDPLVLHDQDEAFIPVPALWLSIPQDWEELLGTQPSLALTWREYSRRFFELLFARGYQIREFSRDENAYLLQKIS